MFLICLVSCLIDHLRISIDPGLVTFTGETGAGKSIIIDALETLLGGRADSNWVRSGVERAFVEGVFSIPEGTKEAIHTLLKEEDLLDDPNWLTLAREIRANGRSTARINGRTVSNTLLREVGENLVDVHGQSEHLSHLRVNQHILLLDRYADSYDKSGNSFPNDETLHSILQRYQHTFKRLLDNQRQLEALQISERDAARRVDMLTFQIEEIESSRLKTNEENELRDERNRLAGGVNEDPP